MFLIWVPGLPHAAQLDYFSSIQHFECSDTEIITKEDSYAADWMKQESNP